MLTVLVFFFFNDTATTEIYTLSLHDALPILRARAPPGAERLVARPQADAPTLRSEPLSRGGRRAARRRPRHGPYDRHRSEEHTSELQSQSNLVCRLLLEKKKERILLRTTSAI